MSGNSHVPAHATSLPDEGVRPSSPLRAQKGLMLSLSLQTETSACFSLPA